MDSLVTQGDAAHRVIQEELTVESHIRNAGRTRLEFGLMRWVPKGPTLWLTTYRPANYGRVHPQRSLAWPQYLATLKEFVDAGIL